jgi:putative transcriptional regulator
MDATCPWLTGQLLLALPGVGDPRFDRAVIAMVSHGPEGAMGVGIGQLLAGVTMAAVFDQLGMDGGAARDAAVLDGGPVERQRGFVLHSRDWGGEDAVDVAGVWMLSASHDVLRAIGEGRGPSRWQFILGYAGWDGGQLEGEFARHAWHAAPATETLMFDTPAEHRWSAAFASVGVDARLLTGTGGTA